MFKLHNPTEQEQLLFAKAYIKELKIQNQLHKQNAENAILNLRNFINDVRALSKRGSRLISFKEENVAAHQKNKRLSAKLLKIEHKNYLLRQKLKQLENERATD